MDLTGYPVHEARIVHFCGLAKNHNILKHCAETFDEHQLALASLFTDLPLLSTHVTSISSFLQFPPLKVCRVFVRSGI